MEGEQKRVFLILAEDEIAGIQPPKGVYFTKFLATAQELWVSKKAAKQKENPYMLIGKRCSNDTTKTRADKGNGL